MKKRGRKSNTEEKFWSFADRSGGQSACWPWTRALSPSGYGRFRMHWTNWRAHVLALYLTTGVKSKCACHKCDNRACINPAHLWDGTNKQNSEDMVRKGRSASGERNWNAKLTAKDIATIRRVYVKKYGERLRLAKQYGVHPKTIAAIVKRCVWKSA